MWLTEILVLNWQAVLTAGTTGLMVFLGSFVGERARVMNYCGKGRRPKINIANIFCATITGIAVMTSLHYLLKAYIPLEALLGSEATVSYFFGLCGLDLMNHFTSVNGIFNLLMRTGRCAYLATKAYLEFQHHEQNTLFGYVMKLLRFVWQCAMAYFKLNRYVNKQTALDKAKEPAKE